MFVCIFQVDSYPKRIHLWDKVLSQRHGNQDSSSHFPNHDENISTKIGKTLSVVFAELNFEGKAIKETYRRGNITKATNTHFLQEKSFLQD